MLEPPSTFSKSLNFHIFKSNPPTSILEPRRGSSTNLQAGLVWQDIFVPTFLTRWCCVHLLYIKMECRLHTYIKDIHRLNYRLAKASSDLRTAETTFVRGYLYGRVGIPRNVKAECVIRPKR